MPFHIALPAGSRKSSALCPHSVEYLRKSSDGFMNYVPSGYGTTSHDPPCCGGFEPQRAGRNASYPVQAAKLRPVLAWDQVTLLTALVTLCLIDSADSDAILSASVQSSLFCAVTRSNC